MIRENGCAVSIAKSITKLQGIVLEPAISATLAGPKGMLCLDPRYMDPLVDAGLLVRTDETGEGWSATVYRLAP